jgi:predicted permease
MNITLPSDAVIQIGAQVSDGLSTYAPIIALLLGIMLAFFIVEFIIGTLRDKKDKNDK